MEESKVYLKTTCLHCKEEFLLNWLTVGIKHTKYDDGDDEVKIHCPHCQVIYYPC